MSWKQRVTVVVLVLFTSLPVSGTLCAMMCASAATAASSHHGSDKKCEEVAHASTGVQIEGTSARDCGSHEAAVRHIASTPPERVALKSAAIVLALSARHTSFRSLPLGAPTLDAASPNGTAPRTTTPLVQRV